MKSCHHLYTLHRTQGEDRLFLGSVPKMDFFNSRWFVVNPHTGEWFAPRDWHMNVDKVAKLTLSRPVHQLQERVQKDRCKLLCRGLVNLPDLLTEDRLSRASWVFYAREPSQCQGPSMSPLQLPTLPATNVLIDGWAILFQESPPSEGLDPPTCDSFFFFIYTLILTSFVTFTFNCNF